MIEYKLARRLPRPDARFHAATLRALNQIRAKQSRRATFAPRRALLIAAILLAALTATGFATGAFQGIFASIGGRWTEPPASDYAHLDETAARDASSSSMARPPSTSGPSTTTAANMRRRRSPSH